MFVNGRWQEFTRYNIGIFTLPPVNHQPVIIKYWEKTRNHWRKNRKIFNLIFSYTTVPLRILRLLEKKKNRFKFDFCMEKFKIYKFMFDTCFTKKQISKE